MLSSLVAHELMLILIAVSFAGQRQRVSLARAAYANADIYLLDSPLSAVDWHTCNHIMHFCIKGLLKGKTIIMVTHQLSLLADFDVTAIVKEGRFDYCGPFNTEVLLVCVI
jgi:ABC-type transport system involved in cytochrome bd biosynthesis fused ATPase/permease subunit